MAPRRKRRKKRSSISGGGKISEIVPLEPLQEPRGRISRFLRDDSGEPSDRFLASLGLLAAAGTALNPATAPLNEATAENLQGQLLSRGLTRDEIERQAEERRFQAGRGSGLGTLASIAAPPSPIGVGTQIAPIGAAPQLQAQAQAPQLEPLTPAGVPSLTNANVTGGGTQRLPFPGGLILPPGSPFVGRTPAFNRPPTRFGRELRL